MTSHRLRLIGIALAALACWWCATRNSPLPAPASALVAPPQASPVSPESGQSNAAIAHSHQN